jgi:ATP-dependent Clp protease ATP-binding subunit ClpX
MAEFDEARIKRIVALAEKAKQAEQQHWTAESIFTRLDETIIGNERYKKSLAICLADFLSEAMIRNHLLIIGPSGTGKTYLLQECLPSFGLPYHLIDASSLVPAGIVGNRLKDSLDEFFGSNVMASRRCVIVLDEFDKISEKANGGDTQKSHSIQSELLALIQGKQEGPTDTRNALWLMAGAFAYTDEMKRNPPKVAKNDLLKYGFKNELLGRITKLTMTDIPTVDDVVRRVAKDKVIAAFSRDLAGMGYDVDFQDQAFLELAMAAQNPNFGMRIIPTVVAELKEYIIFKCKKGKIDIEPRMIKEALEK